MRSERHFARYAFLGLLAILALSQVAAAGTTTGLHDWCVNVNGGSTAAACNGGVWAGGGGVSGASISMGDFDTTLGSNALGSIVITLDPGFSGYASFYADYDLDYATYGSFDDTASTVNALPSWGFEADDPNTSNIFADFSGNKLTNANNVGTPSSSTTNQCCDVSFALSMGNISVGAQPETLTFSISTTAPASGFYIQQTNTDVGDSIYLSANESGGGSTNPPPVPEPPTLVLAVLGGLSVLMLRRLSAA